MRMGDAMPTCKKKAAAVKNNHAKLCVFSMESGLMNMTFHMTDSSAKGAEVSVVPFS